TISGGGNVIFSGGTTTVGGAYSITGTTSVTGGTVNFSQGVGLPNLSVSSGVLNCVSTMTIAQSLNWSGGTLGGTGTTTIQGGAQLNVSGPNYKILDGRTLNNSGTTVWTGTGGILLANGARFTNQNLLEAQSDATISWIGGSVTSFTNAGTFR